MNEYQELENWIIGCEPLEDFDTFDLIDYITDMHEFWKEFSIDKKLLFKCLECAEWDDIKDFLKKESKYRHDNLKENTFC